MKMRSISAIAATGIHRYSNASLLRRIYRASAARLIANPQQPTKVVQLKVGEHK
jgi:hypothetical protein